MFDAIPLEKIEELNGEKWIACTAQEPKPAKVWVGLRVYHPSAISDYSSSDGSDDHYTCPHCKTQWWVEYD